MAKKVLPLSELQIRKSGIESFPLFDGGGLHLILSPSGAKLWRLKYRRPDRRENRISLGAWPDVSLAEARVKREECRAMLRAGLDPAVERAAKVDQAQAEARATFNAVADDWLTFKAPGWAAQTERRARYVLDKYLRPKIGRLSIATLSTRDVAPILETMGHAVPDLARRARQYVGGIVRYAQRRGLRDEARALPLDEVIPAHAAGHVPAAVDPEAIRKVLKAIEAYPSPVTRAALWMCAYTAQRPGNVAAMRWADIVETEWRIPGSQLKVRQRAAHIVPLPRQAVAVLDAMRPYTAGREYVFPPLARQQTPHLHRDALSGALRRMNLQGEHSAHGFRGMLRTAGRERLGIAAEILEAQLAHAKRGTVAQAYDRTTFDQAREDAMQKWADWLEGLAGAPDEKAA